MLLAQRRGRTQLKEGGSMPSNENHCEWDVEWEWERGTQKRPGGSTLELLRITAITCGFLLLFTGILYLGLDPGQSSLFRAGSQASFPVRLQTELPDSGRR
jgi:hypothetical protein